MKTANEDRTEEQCKKIEKGMMTGNSKEAYNTLKALIKIFRYNDTKKSYYFSEPRSGWAECQFIKYYSMTELKVFEYS